MLVLVNMMLAKRGVFVIVMIVLASCAAFLKWTFGQIEDLHQILEMQKMYPSKMDHLSASLRGNKIVDNRDGARGPLRIDQTKSHESEGQPAAILKHMRGKKGGTFFDAGANDGQFQSSTLMLETKHGWTGILVEPVPWMYQKLVETNRKAMFLEGCVSPKPFPYVAEMKIGKPPNSSTDTNHAWSHLDGHEVYAIRGDIARVSVDCYPLINILTAAGLRSLDVLCLDVQGPELQILNTVPWDMVDIKLLVLENDHREGDGHQRLFNNTASFLAPKGYKFVEKVGFDYFFLKVE